MLRAVKLSALVSLALLSSGCVFVMPDRIHYTLKPLESESAAECAQSEPTGQIVGLALSGGGSRAAVYAAAGMEALWEHGLVGKATHISSVSGGSIAASYFKANQPTCESAGSEADEKACWREFFSEFKDAMRYNIWYRMEWRQIYHPNRFLSPTRRTTSLQEVLDGRFLHQKTFGDILQGAEEGAEGGAEEGAEGGPGKLERPVLLINATSYDEGRRFVFSNQCLPAIDTAQPASSQSGATRHFEPLARAPLRALTFSRASCIRRVPRDLPLSLAVASSAAFPPLIGPVAFQVPTTCTDNESEWWHLGDGGIIDNTGIDTLEELVLLEAQQGQSELERALIVSLDGGRVSRGEKMKQTRNLRLWTRDPGVVADMAKPRGDAYHDIVWEGLEQDLAAQGVSFGLVRIPYTKADLDRWPASCGKKKNKKGDDDAVREAIQARLEAIPTDLEITACHADLIEMAAHEIVHAVLSGTTARQLGRIGIPIPEIPDCPLSHGSEEPAAATY